MRWILALGFLFSSFEYSFTQTASTPVAERIDSLLQECEAQVIFNGVALVVDDGKLLLNQGYGFTDPSHTTRLQANDCFNIGSITKQFTAFLVLRLHEEGLLSIHDPLEKYLHILGPESPDSGNRDWAKDYARISIYHLLTHTSGIPNFTSNPKFNSGEDYTETEMFEIIGRPLEFEPGSRFNYSNSGYYLLGKILEQVSKISYGDLLEREIFEPLEMSNSSFPLTWPKEGIANGYWRTIEGMAPMPKYSPLTTYSTGGIFSTSGDLLKWEQALYDEDFLSSELRELMFTPYKNNYGCGWYVRQGYHEDGTYYERHLHGGMIKGYHAFIFRRIPQKQTIILLDNNYNQEIQEIKNSIWRVLEGRSIRVPQPKLSNLLFSASAEQYLLPLLDSLTNHPAHYQEDYFFEEYDINTVGYRLMNAGRFKEAEALLKFNISLYPEAWNVYDSLGECYLKMERMEDSREMYNRSLELNPDNTSAVEALKNISD